MGYRVMGRKRRIAEELLHLDRRVIPVHARKQSQPGRKPADENPDPRRRQEMPVRPGSLQAAGQTPRQAPSRQALEQAIRPGARPFPAFPPGKQQKGGRCPSRKKHKPASRQGAEPDLADLLQGAEAGKDSR